MANRFWVGNGGTWDTTTTTHWSTTSGGAGGASAPTVTDNVFFDTNSFGVFGGVVTASSAVCLNLTSTTTRNVGLDASTISVYGNVSLARGGPLVIGSQLILKATGSATADFGGGGTFPLQTSLNNLVFDGIGGIWTLVNHGVDVNFNSSESIAVVNGSVIANGFTINGANADVSMSPGTSVDLTGSTLFASTFTANGILGNTIAITGGTLNATGTVSVSYAVITNNTATGTHVPFLDYPGGTDGGGNTNWVFTVPVLSFPQVMIF